MLRVGGAVEIQDFEDDKTEMEDAEEEDGGGCMYLCDMLQIRGSTELWPLSGLASFQGSRVHCLTVPDAATAILVSH